jgi:hypothetical protein
MSPSIFEEVYGSSKMQLSDSETAECVEQLSRAQLKSIHDNEANMGLAKF